MNILKESLCFVMVKHGKRIDIHASRALSKPWVAPSLRLLKQWRKSLASGDAFCTTEVLTQLAVDAPQTIEELMSTLSSVWKDEYMRIQFIVRHGFTVLGLLHSARTACGEAN